MKVVPRLLVPLLVLLASSGALCSQTGFVPEPEFYNVWQVVHQPDRKILAVGSRRLGGGQIGPLLERMNPDGSRDPGFGLGAGFNGFVSAVAVQPDGKILAVGNFTRLNGLFRNRYARLHPDGSVDMSFAPNAGANSRISDLALQPDGKIVIVGGFWRVHEVARPGVARVNPDGSLDASFDPRGGVVPDSVVGGGVGVVALQPDGKVLIGGNFSAVDGIPRTNFARLHSDGSLDTSFNPDLGAQGYVSAICVQTDGKILVGGRFTTINGTPRSRIARLNQDGSVDVDFDPGAGANGDVLSIAVQPGGKIVVAGYFVLFNGLPFNRAARLNADGSLDHSFNPGVGPNYHVTTVALQPDNKILTGGFFWEFNGVPLQRLARLNHDGSLDYNWPPEDQAGSSASARVAPGGSYCSAVPTGSIAAVAVFWLLPLLLRRRRALVLPPWLSRR